MERSKCLFPPNKLAAACKQGTRGTIRSSCTFVLKTERRLGLTNVNLVPRSHRFYSWRVNARMSLRVFVASAKQVNYFYQTTIK